MASTSESRSPPENNDNLIDQFCSVTGANKEKAAKMLEICSWNLEMAVNMHVDSDYQDNDSNAGLSNDNMNNGHEDGDTVRPPIPPTRAVLVEEDLTAHYGLRGRKRRPRSIFDGFRDFQAEARWQEVAVGVGASDANSEALKKRKTLEDLFRPPLDLIHRGSFESARDLGQSTKRWLMVNIQDSQEFSCQVLNRDVWSNQAVKSIISEHFIFWQVYCDSAEGQRYMQFYNPVQFPYIAVIDPRTGENLIVWNKIDSLSFCDMVTTFLTECKTPDGPSGISKLDKPPSLLDESEDQQMKAAVEASLKDVASTIVEDEESDLETFDSDSESQSSKPLKCKDTEILKSEKKVEDTEYCTENKVQGSEKWVTLLGQKEDPVTELVLRLPDGKREQISWPCTTQLEALLLFVESLGYEQEQHELVTNFPRRNLCQLPLNHTLKDVGLFPREMIFVQLKNC